MEPIRITISNETAHLLAISSAPVPYLLLRLPEFAPNADDNFSTLWSPIRVGCGEGAATDEVVANWFRPITTHLELPLPCRFHSEAPVVILRGPILKVSSLIIRLTHTALH